MRISKAQVLIRMASWLELHKSGVQTIVESTLFVCYIILSKVSKTKCVCMMYRFRAQGFDISDRTLLVGNSISPR